ncbi:MAG: ribosomal-protein-alanine N-acetyltransferase [Deltaproteobacteria bacterium RIFCSPLOWO2_12_FULL_44_12]|nr:MAG: ribosomal-protein-alanine N-acetyltransferase [Deltaproteobacteria bacterium RIFCSPHIGHO2_01_FULL_43_49]OGQ16447.1 MAG: ribosomal-protein-alanine N-acetyltransferase [Deltaproteobacteria bacterium RIFCSPHIGHO2_02_FULL_44_53]OGQ27725.1 MAG: ribosomal-protein-alanine N-acetyltransferase [Deltaproteobacteria bacterium RIFCSPHIGHO2_12_FULL_44_21]OGQ32965.1 MAG: ribosomal-protein-alanine N-acetyltransferase [Deltaproteobacteria bacterium RIFCSPLOWO2_01_FULL_45_74]OGQ42067.1 MAG: ribosomal-pr
MTILIRPFESGDLDSVVQIENQVFTTPWSKQSFLDCSRWPEFWFRVAEQNKKVVGYFVAQVVPPEAELHNIAVDPAFQKKGVGRLLLSHLLTEIKKVGVKDVFLLVRPSNIAAIHLYQQFEFCLLDKRPRYYEDTKEDALIFYKALDT